jgi:hypothetical protein
VSGNVTTRDQFKNARPRAGPDDRRGPADVRLAAGGCSGVRQGDRLLRRRSTRSVAEGLQQTIDQFNGFAESLKKYRDSLFTTGATLDITTGLMRSRFDATVALAAQGDATAFGNLQNDAKAYLDAAKNSAHSSLEYQRAVSQVAAGVDKGIFAAESTADYAQLQLDALQNATNILQQIAGNTAATAAALGQPVAVSQAVPQPVTATPAPSPSTASSDQIVQQLRDINAGIVAIATSTNRTATQLRRWDGDGLTVKTDADSPLQVQS